MSAAEIQSLEEALRRARSGDIAKVLRYLKKDAAVVAAIRSAQADAGSNGPAPTRAKPTPPQNPPGTIPVTTRPRRRFLREPGV